MPAAETLLMRTCADAAAELSAPGLGAVAVISLVAVEVETEVSDTGTFAVSAGVAELAALFALDAVSGATDADCAELEISATLSASTDMREAMRAKMPGPIPFTFSMASVVAKGPCASR
jgi:hypothetical protein